MSDNKRIGKITFTGIANPKEGEYLGIYDVFTIEANGQNLKQITFGDEWLSNSSLSPDGTKIAFTQIVGEDNDEHDIFLSYVMNSDGTDKRLLTEKELGYGTTLCFSPDSKRILFAHDGLYTIDVNGTNLKHILMEAGVHSASFSADELSIIYIYTRVTKTLSGKISNIEPIGFFIMDTDGSNQRLLYPFSLLGKNCQEWVISPDGSKMAYVAYTKSGCTVDKKAVYLVDLPFDLNSPEPRKLTDGFDSVGSPVFSPDSSHLAFIEHKLNQSRAYTICVDGSDLQPLTNGVVPIPVEFSPFSWVE